MGRTPALEYAAVELSLILGAVGVFLGALVQGTTGFGIAFIATPALLLLLPQTVVAPVMVLLSLGNNAVVLAGARRALSPNLVLPMVAGGVLGLPLGAWLLKVADPQWFKFWLGIFVIVAGALMLSGIKRRFRHQRTGLGLAGFLGGVLHTSTTISGPPVILYLSNQGIDKERFRVALISYFMAMNVVSIAVFAWFKLLPRQIFTTALAFAVPLVLGSLAGVWLSRRVNEELFRRIVLATILALGIALIAASLLGLLRD